MLLLMPVSPPHPGLAPAPPPPCNRQHSTGVGRYSIRSMGSRASNGCATHWVSVCRRALSALERDASSASLKLPVGGS
jgi:hypothetical protein